MLTIHAAFCDGKPTRSLLTESNLQTFVVKALLQPPLQRATAKNPPLLSMMNSLTRSPVVISSMRGCSIPSTRVVIRL